MGKCEKSDYVNGIKKFVGRLQADKGPFFNGSSTMTYVDMVVLPWLARNYVLYAWKQFNIENELETGELALYEKWIEAIRNEESVKVSLPKDQEILVTVNVSKQTVYIILYIVLQRYTCRWDSELMLPTSLWLASSAILIASVWKSFLVKIY